MRVRKVGFDELLFPTGDNDTDIPPHLGEVFKHRFLIRRHQPGIRFLRRFHFRGFRLLFLDLRRDVGIRRKGLRIAPLVGAGRADAAVDESDGDLQDLVELHGEIKRRGGKLVRRLRGTDRPDAQHVRQRGYGTSDHREVTDHGVFHIRHVGCTVRKPVHGVLHV